MASRQQYGRESSGDVRIRWSRALPIGTLVLLGVLLAVGLLTSEMSEATHRAWVQRLGFDLEAARSLRLWTLPLATLFEADAGVGIGFLFIFAATGSAVWLLEAVAGARRMLLIFFLADWAASILRLVTVGCLAALGSSEASALLHVGDTGSSAAATGALAAAVVNLRGTRAKVGLVVLGAWLLIGALYFRLDVSIVHTWGAVAGVCLGRLMIRRREEPVEREPSEVSRLASPPTA